MKQFLKHLINMPLSAFGLKVVRNSQIVYPVIPVEATPYERELIEKCINYSMTGYIRMWALLQSLKYIICNSIPGDLVECGVWKGGNLALMRLFTAEQYLRKNVIGFDTFDGMPEATEYDIDLFGNKASLSMKNSVKDENIKNIHAYAGIEQVKNNLESLGVKDGIKLIQGKVEETLLNNDNLPEMISLLRLDTDWYESTKIELEVLYPRLVKGGVLIIDDYGHFEGARKAVDNYFENKNIWLHYIDYTCRLIIKD